MTSSNVIYLFCYCVFLPNRQCPWKWNQAWHSAEAVGPVESNVILSNLAIIKSVFGTLTFIDTMESNRWFVRKYFTPMSSAFVEQQVPYPPRSPITVRNTPTPIRIHTPVSRYSVKFSTFRKVPRIPMSSSVSLSTIVVPKRTHTPTTTIRIPTNCNRKYKQVLNDDLDFSWRAEGFHIHD